MKGWQLRHSPQKAQKAQNELRDFRVLTIGGFFFVPFVAIPQKAPSADFCKRIIPDKQARSPLQYRGLRESCEAAVGVGIRRDAPYRPSL